MKRLWGVLALCGVVSAHAETITTSPTVYSVAGKTGTITLGCSDLTNAGAFCNGTDAASLSGTINTARISGSYTGITGVGALTAGSTGAGFTLAFGSATLTGQVPVANGGTNCAAASITCFNNITGFSAAGTTGTTSTNLVFSTSPTLTTPNIGAATGTSLATGGATLGSNGISAQINFAGQAGIAIKNTNSGGASEFVSTGDTGINSIFGVWGSAFASYGAITAGDPILYGNGTTVIMADNAPLVFAAGSAGPGEIARVNSTGIVMASGKKLTFESSTTGAGVQTFTNSPCVTLSTEQYVPVTITGQTGTWYIAACK